MSIEDLKNTLQDMCLNLRGIAGGTVRPEEFDLENFWRKLEYAVQEVHMNSKKIFFAFSWSPISPKEEVAVLMISTKKACTDIFAVFAELPKYGGSELRREISDYLKELFKAVHDFVSLISSERNSQHLEAARELWKKCDAVESIPKDNKQSVICVYRRQSECVQGAIDKIREVCDALTPELHDLAGYSVFSYRRISQFLREKALLNPALQLARNFWITMLSVGIAVDSHGQCITPQENGQLDKIGAMFRLCSRLMDDFVASLFPPVTASLVRAHGNALKTHVWMMLSEIRSMLLEKYSEWGSMYLALVSHVYSEDHDGWMSYVNNAVEQSLQDLLACIGNI